MPDTSPNILFLMCDQLQAQVLEADHPCLTPHLDRLIERGVRFTRAYTPNAICSPARASLMTGLLPHNHGMATVHHCQPRDQFQLRRDRPHWAQRLHAAGYLTGYFGKWHVEHDETPTEFGWRVDGSMHSGLYQLALIEASHDAAPEEWTIRHPSDLPEGYRAGPFYGVRNIPRERRAMGITTKLARRFLQQAVRLEQPWCCFASVPEPHDPFITTAESFALYDVDSLPLPANARDEMADKPGLYRKLAQQWHLLSEREQREAAACYYASISEIDGCFGELLNEVEAAGQLDNTIVVLTTDHGELLGAHGLYCKNVGAFEEVYNVPLLVSGPQMASGVTTTARVGLHDLCPTLCELAGVEGIDNTDSRSFADVLRQPHAHEDAFTTGFAEYSGARYLTTQRVYWEGPWKLVHNGFDFDELYNLDEDPHEVQNLAGDPAHADRLREMFAGMWRRIRDTGDQSLYRTHYPAQRFAPHGPNIAE